MAKYCKFIGAVCKKCRESSVSFKVPTHKYNVRHKQKIVFKCNSCNSYLKPDAFLVDKDRMYRHSLAPIYEEFCKQNRKR